MNDDKKENEQLDCCVKDIKQNNDTKVDITQKNITIVYFDDSNSLIPNLKPLEDILDEGLELEIDEKGNIKLNNEEMQVKELENGARVLICEEEKYNID